VALMGCAGARRPFFRLSLLSLSYNKCLSYNKSVPLEIVTLHASSALIYCTYNRMRCCENSHNKRRRCTYVSGAICRALTVQCTVSDRLAYLYCWAAGGRWCGGAEGRALWVNFGCCAIVHKWFVCSRLYPCSLSLSLLSVSPPPASSCCPFCNCGIDPSACMRTGGSSAWFMCVLDIVRSCRTHCPVTSQS